VIVRQFIRHPSDVPIKYSFGDVVAHRKEYLRDISRGGLCFRSAIEMEPGAVIHVQIPVCRPVFEADGVVVWCHPESRHFLVGVSFRDAKTEFGVRMVEQVCHIEHYKKEVRAKEGRTLSGEEAALEWIAAHARDFPR
jgi:hypothetical protein